MPNRAEFSQYREATPGYEQILSAAYNINVSIVANKLQAHNGIWPSTYFHGRCCYVDIKRELVIG